MADSGSILIVASSKGGVGKTTISICLAVNLAALGYRVAGVDADRNQAFANWHKTADSPPLTCFTCIDHNEIVGHCMTAAESADIVLVDTAGFENQTAIFAMGAADLVLIPVMPDRNSVLEAGKTAKQVASVSKATFGGDVPRSGFTGLQVGRLIDELRGLEAIPAKPSRKAA